MINKIMLGGAYSSLQLAKFLSTKEYKVEGNMAKDRNCRSKPALISRMFTDLMLMIIDDVIDGHIFRLPVGNCRICLSEEPPALTDRKNRKTDRDLFKMKFKQYAVKLKCKTRGRISTFTFLVGKQLNDKIADKAEKGEIREFNLEW